MVCAKCKKKSSLSDFGLLAENLHHFPVAVRLLRQLLGLRHLQHLPQQVEGQVQGDGRLLGAAWSLRRGVAQSAGCLGDLVLLTEQMLRESELQSAFKHRGRRFGAGLRLGLTFALISAHSDEVFLSQPCPNGPCAPLVSLLFERVGGRGGEGASLPGTVQCSALVHAWWEGNKQSCGSSDEKMELHCRGDSVGGKTVTITRTLMVIFICGLMWNFILTF